MRIVYMGTPEFAVAPLQSLMKAGHKIEAVVTMPDKPVGRGQVISESAVKKYAKEAGLPILQPEKLKAEDFVDKLRDINADLFVVVAFRMLPEVVWNMPKYGTINLHASLLPDYRGAAPINWAVINGDKKTGVTTFRLSHEIDTGDVLMQESIDIADSDDAGTVHDHLMELGSRVLVETVDKIEKGEAKPIPQCGMQGIDTARPAPKIFKNDMKIDWSMPAISVHNKVRGLSPYPTAWTIITDEKGAEIQTKIYRTAITNMPSNAIPGTLSTDGKRLFIAAADNLLEICELQAAGKKRMPTADFLRGFRIGK